jgi:hypothetical protein
VPGHKYRRLNLCWSEILGYILHATFSRATSSLGALAEGPAKDVDHAEEITFP